MSILSSQMVTFLRRCLDEQQQTAEAVTTRCWTWSYVGPNDEIPPHFDGRRHPPITTLLLGSKAVGASGGPSDPLTPEEGRFIASGDPETALAEIAFKRAIIDRAAECIRRDEQQPGPGFEDAYAATAGEYRLLLALLADQYQRWPGYRAEFRSDEPLV